MGVRISEMDPLVGGLTKDDKFEVSKASENKTYSATAKDIANYAKNQNNGGFRGSTTESLDNWDKTFIGVWKWNGNDGPNGISQGIVELISQTSEEDDADDFIQRFSAGAYVYQRTKVDNGAWSAWASLTNRNGCRIQYGTSSNAHVTFEVQFSNSPSVVVTPINSTTDTVLIHNVYGVSASGFDVRRYKSSLVSVMEETTEETTQSSVSTTTTKKSETTRGAWEADTSSFYWIAILEEG